ncbi:hypothetical protein Drorol1_Dr00013071 [Drosera rotundifolia]
MFLLFVGFSLSNLFRACQGMWRIGTSSTDIRLSECCVGCATLSNRWAVCVQKYGVNMGEYFCEICKFYDYDIKNEQFHCDDCGICSFLRYGILNYLENDQENIGIVVLLQDVSEEKAKELVQKCPRNVFDMEDFAGGNALEMEIGSSLLLCDAKRITLYLRSSLQEPYLLKSSLPKLLRSWKISMYASLLNYHDIWGLRQ